MSAAQTTGVKKMFEMEEERTAIEFSLLDAFRCGDMERLSALTPCDIIGVMDDNRFVKETVF